MTVHDAGRHWPPAVFLPGAPEAEGRQTTDPAGTSLTLPPPFLPAETGRWLGSPPPSGTSLPESGLTDLESITEALLTRLEAWSPTRASPGTAAEGGEATGSAREADPAADLSELLERLARELRDEGELRVSARPDASRLELLLRGVLMGYLLRSEGSPHPDRPR